MKNFKKKIGKWLVKVGIYRLNKRTPKHSDFFSEKIQKY